MTKAKCLMTKLLFIFGSLVISHWLFVTPVFAHFLETDGEIGAVLHINPSDDPVAGTESTMFFDIKDKSNKFKLENCICTFSVSLDDQNLSTQKFEPSEFTGNVVYTFPKKGVYQLELTGDSTDNSFPSFRLAYDTRVDQSVSQNSQEQNWLTKYSIFIFEGILIIGFLSVILHRGK